MEPLIKDLTKLLEDCDTSAEIAVEKLQELLKGTEAGRALSLVERCISEYDSEEAAKRMKIVVNQLAS